MGNKRHKPEEIVTKLSQVEVLCGQGMPRIDAKNHLLLPTKFLFSNNVMSKCPITCSRAIHM